MSNSGTISPNDASALLDDVIDSLVAATASFVSTCIGLYDADDVDNEPPPPRDNIFELHNATMSEKQSERDV